MTQKEELKKQLTELTKQEVKLIEERVNSITHELLEEIESTHKKRMGIWREIALINEEEQRMRKTY